MDKYSKIPSGSSIINELLDGGYERGIITTIYGPAKSGKTNLCMLSVIRIAGRGKKIIYIDTESSFSIERFKQLTKHYDKVLQNIIFFRPTTFKEQNEVFENLRKIINKNIGIIIVDTIASLYRLELSQNRNISDMNSMLGNQLSTLLALARKQNIPIIITNQVYTDINDGNKIKMTGNLIVKNYSKCLIELQEEGRKRMAIVRKNKSLAGRSKTFEITGNGLKPISQ